MLERYRHSEHYALIRSWFEERGMQPPVPNLLPDFGLVKDRIAVAFLVKTNSGIARIDNIAFAPGSAAGDRDSTCAHLFAALESEAARCGYRAVEVLCGSPKMLARVSRRDFQKYGDYSLMFKEVI